MGAGQTYYRAGAKGSRFTLAGGGAWKGKSDTRWITPGGLEIMPKYETEGSVSAFGVGVDQGYVTPAVYLGAQLTDLNEVVTVQQRVRFLVGLHCNQFTMVDPQKFELSMGWTSEGVNHAIPVETSGITNPSAKMVELFAEGNLFVSEVNAVDVWLLVQPQKGAADWNGDAWLNWQWVFETTEMQWSLKESVPMMIWPHAEWRRALAKETRCPAAWGQGYVPSSSSSQNELDGWRVLNLNDIDDLGAHYSEIK